MKLRGEICAHSTGALPAFGALRPTRWGYLAWMITTRCLLVKRNFDRTVNCCHKKLCDSGSAGADMFPAETGNGRDTISMTHVLAMIPRILKHDALLVTSCTWRPCAARSKASGRGRAPSLCEFCTSVTTSGNGCACGGPPVPATDCLGNYKHRPEPTRRCLI